MTHPSDMVLGQHERLYSKHIVPSQGKDGFLFSPLSIRKIIKESAYVRRITKPDPYFPENLKLIKIAGWLIQFQCNDMMVERENEEKDEPFENHLSLNFDFMRNN